jgi:hypothetical protein
LLTVYKRSVNHKVVYERQNNMQHFYSNYGETYVEYCGIEKRKEAEAAAAEAANLPPIQTSSAWG